MDYTTLITSQHRNKPKFNALVDLTANGVGGIGAVITSMQSLFDVDTATGEQLDTIGLWVGVSRRLEVPLNVFFSWNTNSLGWNEGQWNGAHQAGTTTILLDDDTYRRLMKTVIRANHWDGTLVQYQEIMQTFFPDNIFRAVDNQDMTMTLFVVTGPPLSNIDVQMLTTGPLSKIKPAGVGINIEAPYNFGFSESPTSSGFNQGTFAS